MADDKMDMKLNFDIKVNDLKELDKIETEILTFVQGLNKADEKSKGLARSLTGVGKILDAINKRRKSAEEAQLKALELQLEQNKAAQKGLVTERDRARTEAQRSKIAQRERELEHNASRLQEDISARMERRQVRMQREAKQARQQADREERSAEKERKRTSDYLWNLRQRSARLEAAQAKSETQVENRRARAARQTRDTVASVNQFLNRQVRMLAYKGEVEEKANTQAMKNLRSQTAAALVQQRADIRRAKEKGVYDKAEEQRIQERFTQQMKMSRRSYNADVALGRAEQQRQNAIHRNRMANEREFRREQERHRNDTVRGAFQIGSGVRSLATQGRNAGVASLGAAYGAKRIIDRGISSRYDIDTAETNMKIFGEMDSAEIKKARKGPNGLDAEAIKNGLSIPSTLNAYNEVKKAGLLDPEKQVKNLLAATTALELDVKPTTKLMGTMSRNMGAAATPERLKKTLNAIAIGAREDPTQANEIVEGLNRAQGLLAMSSGITQEDLVGLVSGGQSVGIQPGKAGTFLPALGRDILRGGSKFADPKERQKKNFAAKKLGFGSAKNMAREFAGANGKQVLYQIFQNLKNMPPQLRAQVADALSGGMWGDEDLQIVNGLEGMKKTDSEIHDSKNANFLDQARAKKVESWAGMWAQTKTVWSLFWESFGLGFDGILREINAFFLDLNGKFNYNQIEGYVRDALDGLKEGLGLKTWKEGLEAIFPSDIGGYGTAIKDFAKGFGEGVKSMGETLRSAASLFGIGGGAGGLGRLAGQLMTLSIALLALSPVMSVIGAFAGVLTAIAGTAVALRGIAGMAGTLRLLMGGASMAQIGAMGAGAGAAAGWPIVGTLIAAGFVKYMSSLGANAIDQKLGINPENKLSFSGVQSMLFKPLGPLGYAWDYLMGGGDDKKAESKGSTTQQVIENTQRQIQELDAIVKSVTPQQQQRVLEKIEENTREGATVQKQSFNLQQDSESPFKNLIQKASLGGSLGATAGILRDMGGGGSSLSGGGGGLGARSGGGGGPLIGSSTPGGSLNGITGMRRRGIMGGGYSGGSVGPSGGAATNFAGLAPKIMGDLQKDFGLDKESAAAILGNLGHESAGMTAFQEGNPRGGGRGGWGWAQWTGPRRRAFEAFAQERGLDPKSYEANYGFLKHELNGTHRSSLAAVKNATGLENKTIAFEGSYEAAGVKHYDRRIGYARTAMGLDGNSSGPALAGMGGSSKAVDTARSLIGMGSRQAASALGSKMTPGQWCADFVNGSLASANIKGVNSSIANSFLGWGQKVMDGVKAGDVVVTHRGGGVGQVGGHVGLATGQTRMKNGRLQYQTISGNHGNEVGEGWEYADKVAVRRAQEAVGATTALGKNLNGSFKDVGDGITSSGWKKAGTSGAGLGSSAPAAGGASLGSSTPIRSGGGGGGGAGKMGSGGSTGGKIDIHINGHNKDPKELSNEVQRALQNDMNRRTHDYDGFA